jgi:transketolase
MSETPFSIEKAIYTIRFLSADAIQKANSGHPGLPMGTAAIAHTIWTKHLNHNPANPKWFNRDRFILSGGHGSMLLYSLLHLTGYDLSLEDLKQFRQWDSKTPGHPEYGHTDGVELTTGPLGQGFANGVGFAIAEQHLAAKYNQPEHDIIDHYIYGIVTDGDLMEGITSEAASLAGHLGLSKIIYLYDDNRISIDGSTDISFTENRAKRFESYNWHVQILNDGNDVYAIDNAIKLAKSDPRPSIIVARTIIGFGMPNKAGTAKAHGEPPGADELVEGKKLSNWPQIDFHVPEDVKEFYGLSKDRGKRNEFAWQTKLSTYINEFPELGKDLENDISGNLPADWDTDLPIFETDDKGMASRVASGIMINALASKIPALIGGSADLAPSTKTWINGSPAFQKDSPEGRNFHFGVREHAMGAIINGMSLYPGVIPFGATFLVFADYVRPAIRLSALSHYPTIWVFTHDSIGVGEDGPTHQPIEHLASLRTIPNLVTIRPGDANEVREAWKVAINRRNDPTVLVFTRQNLPTLDREIFSSAEGVAKGGYVLADLGDGDPDMILIASGSEVSLVKEAGEHLAADGKNVRIVSMPSMSLFAQQSEEYRASVLPSSVIKRLAVEAGIEMGWRQWVGDAGKTITIEGYGASAPAGKIFEAYGFTVENVVKTALSL